MPHGLPAVWNILSFLFVLLSHRKFVVNQSLVPVFGSNVPSQGFASVCLFLLLIHAANAVHHE